jgi:hypothetical protein
MSTALRCAGLGHRYGRGLWGLRECNLEVPAGRVGLPTPYHPASQDWLLELTLLTILLALTAAALASGWRATRTRAV